MGISRKTIAFTAILLTAGLTCVRASAQEQAGLNIKNDSRTLRIEAAGFGITLGEKKVTYNTIDKARLGTASWGFLAIDWGFSSLTGINYYDAWQGHGDFLDIRQGKSARFAIEPVSLMVSLDNRGQFWFRTGLKFTFDNFKFTNPVTLAPIENTLMPAKLDGDIRKSKVAGSYVGIPVGFGVKIRKLMISANISAEVLCKGWTKYRKPRTKAVIPGLDRFRSTAGVSVTYCGVGIYADYSLTPFFKPGTGSDCHVLSFGLRLGM
ncbi:MAG: hypothetical protein NC115_12220 [Bacteroidales bacterium]|nr:hypothetical protein [Bacteroidales bacterium]